MRRSWKPPPVAVRKPLVSRAKPVKPAAEIWLSWLALRPALVVPNLSDEPETKPVRLSVPLHVPLLSANSILAPEARLMVAAPVTARVPAASVPAVAALRVPLPMETGEASGRTPAAPRASVPPLMVVFPV